MGEVVTMSPSWEDIEHFVRVLADECGDVVGVYGPPRGGLVLAVMVSHILGVPLLGAVCDGCLVVDDICDSGDTLAPIRRRHPNCKIATMYYVQGAIVVPDFWMYEKRQGDWTVFPWELTK